MHAVFSLHFFLAFLEPHRDCKSKGPTIERELASHTISHHLEPLCPRDNHKMKFDPDGVRWQQGVDSATFKVATYHSGFGGCTVRYASEHGYCTIVRAPDLPVFVGEPVVNTLRCPIHNTWVYRRAKSDGRGFEWCCGCEDCDYCHMNVPGNWLRQ